MENTDFDLDQALHHPDAAEKLNCVLEELDSDTRVTAEDIDSFANLQIRTVSMQKALAALSKHELKPVLGFVPAAGGPLGTSMSRYGMGVGLRGLAGLAQDGIRFSNDVRTSVNLARETVDNIRAEAKAVKDAINKQKAKDTDGQTAGGGSTGGNRTEFRTVEMNGLPLTEIPEVESTRVVEIRNTVYPQVTVRPPAHVDHVGERTPASAYLASVQWRVPPATTYADAFWDNWVARFQTIAQMRVGFNVQSATKFSKVRMTEYVNTIALAVSTYLFYANTYQFTIMEGKNNARNALRSMFHTEDLQYLQLLKERLDHLPIPPKLYNELAHLYGIYHTSEYSSTSSTYSFTPMSLGGNYNLVDSIPTSVGTQGIRHCLSTLVLAKATFEDTCDMLARVLPEWVDVKVGTSQYSAHMYDADHLNVFANSCAVTSNPDNSSTGVMHTPYVNELFAADYDEHYIAFNAHSNVVRGDQQALWSQYITGATGEQWTGFLIPVSSVLENDYVSSRFKYVDNSITATGENWVIDNHNPQAIAAVKGSSIYANTWSGAINQKSTPIGSYRLLGLNSNSCNIPQDDYLSYILDIDVSKTPSRKGRTMNKRKRG